MFGDSIRAHLRFPHSLPSHQVEGGIHAHCFLKARQRVGHLRFEFLQAVDRFCIYSCGFFGTLLLTRGVFG